MTAEKIPEDVSRHVGICAGCSAHRSGFWGIPYIACVPAEISNRTSSTQKPNMVGIPQNCPNGFIATATEKPLLKPTVS